VIAPRTIFVTIAVFVTTTHPAAADYAAVRVAVGAAVPTGDSAYKQHVDTSPLADASVAYNWSGFVGMVSAGVTDLQLAPNPTFATSQHDPSAMRLRFLAHAGFEHKLTPKLTANIRVGAGVDLTYTSYDFPTGGGVEHRTENESGLAFEAGLGAWFDVGFSVQVGGELAIPMAFHGTYVDAFSPLDFTYTSIEGQLLIGVRVTSSSYEQ
jgi:hypothetical protein